MMSFSLFVLSKSARPELFLFCNDSLISQHLFPRLFGAFPLLAADLLSPLHLFACLTLYHLLNLSRKKNPRVIAVESLRPFFLTFDFDACWKCFRYTHVDVLFTFCPPLPLERTKDSLISSSWISRTSILALSACSFNGLTEKSPMFHTAIFSDF